MNKNAETIICTWTGRRLPSAAANVTAQCSFNYLWGLFRVVSNKKDFERDVIAGEGPGKGLMVGYFRRRRPGGRLVKGRFLFGKKLYPFLRAIHTHTHTHTHENKYLRVFH